MSWWPKENIWETSGFNVGYWSCQAERWFQGRLALIKSGKATLIRATHWRSLLRYDKARTDEIMRNNVTRCQTYLAKVSRTTKADSKVENAEELIPRANRHAFFAK